jgi:RNA polymerase sigma-70 factor (ECF subfamily)
MAPSADTCWTLVRAAAAGEPGAGRLFAESYLGIVRAFLVQRWRGWALLAQVDDAVQEVFLDLFRAGGALARVDRVRTPSFRGFLFGVARKVALRHEERAAHSTVRRAGAAPVETLAADERTMSREFDLAWARAMVARAGQRQRAWAASAGDEAARQRVQILDLRFGEGVPIRGIAERLGLPPERVHREYAKAREEFKQALRAELAAHGGRTGDELERECLDLLAMLS